ncbi:MAG: hypothetical protein WDO24_03735 [Pseudomonadota bacterium]
MEPLDYFAAADLPTIRRDYPLGNAFTARFRGMSRDALRALQEQRFAAVMAFAWTVPFYRRHWGKAGIEPGDIAGLGDIAKLPAYSKADLMASVEQFPPLGDFHGLETYPAERRPPLILHTTSGTTGSPQPLTVRPEEPRDPETGCWRALLSAARHAARRRRALGLRLRHGEWRPL